VAHFEVTTKWNAESCRYDADLAAHAVDDRYALSKKPWQHLEGRRRFRPLSLNPVIGQVYWRPNGARASNPYDLVSRFATREYSVDLKLRQGNAMRRTTLRFISATSVPTDGIVKATADASLKAPRMTWKKLAPYTNG